MKKAISAIITGIMILQVFSILEAPASAEIYDDFLERELDGIVPGEIIVKFKPRTEDEEISRINSGFPFSV